MYTRDSETAETVVAVVQMRDVTPEVQSWSECIVLAGGKDHECSAKRGKRDTLILVCL